VWLQNFPLPILTTLNSKYHASPTFVDGIRFDSKREADRWHELRLLELAGAITHIRRQVPYPLMVGDCKIGDYRADFEYIDVATGKLVTEDVKSQPTRTPLYKWKRKHFFAQRGYSITEVY